jgi:hypothetical protein
VEGVSVVTAHPHISSSCSAKAGHPVRRDFTVQSLTPLEYWITRFRG